MVQLNLNTMTIRSKEHKAKILSSLSQLSGKFLVNFFGLFLIDFIYLVVCRSKCYAYCLVQFFRAFYACYLQALETLLKTGRKLIC